MAIVITSAYNLVNTKSQFNTITFQAFVFTQLATFKAGDKRKTTHQHLFIPKDYSGSPTSSIYTEWSKEEAKAYLTTGWGEGAITEFKLEYLYGPELEVSRE